jgi:hypothetical protein
MHSKQYSLTNNDDFSKGQNVKAKLLELEIEKEES